jgi:hypothetical protein
MNNLILDVTAIIAPNELPKLFKIKSKRDEDLVGKNPYNISKIKLRQAPARTLRKINRCELIIKS